MCNDSVFSVLLVQSDSRLFHTMERAALLTSYSNVSNFGTLAPLLHLEVSTYFSYSGCKSKNTSIHNVLLVASILLHNLI